MNTKRASQGMSRRGVRSTQRGRRDFLTIMGGASAALFAAACGGSTTKSNSAPTTVATRAAAATSGAAATAIGTAAAVRTTPAAPVKVSTVTYFGANSAPEELEWNKKFNDDFAAAFPQYRAEDSEFSNSSDWIPKLQTSIASNTTPDWLFRDSNGTDLPTLWDQGLLTPVNDVMENVYKLAGGKENFTKSAVDRYTLPTGELIGMPMAFSSYVFWFRQDLMQQAGLTPPAGHWDFNFLLKAAKALHNPPKVYGFAMPTSRTSTAQYIAPFIFGNGGHLVSQDLKDVIFDSPEVREAVDLIKELAQYVPPGAETWGAPDQVGAIVMGTSAMGIYQGRVLPNLVKQNPSLIGKMSNTLIPYNKEPRDWGGPAPHALFKNAKNPQGAKEMIAFSMTKQQYINWMLTAPGFYISAIPAYQTDPSYTNNDVLKQFDPKLLATFVESGKASADFFKEGPEWKINPKAGTLQGALIINDIVQKVAIGKESTQSAVTFGANTIRDIMKS